jgi:peptidoglycan hydrolase CwlO-like protein
MRSTKTSLPRPLAASPAARRAAMHATGPAARRSAGSALRRAAIGAGAITALLASSLVPASSGDLQNQISAGQAAASSLQSQIKAESAAISQTTGGLDAARARLAEVQSELTARIAELRSVQTELLSARTRLVNLENELRVATGALEANLRAEYEGAQPDLMTVILNSHGFTQLLNQVTFIQRIGKQDAQIVGNTRAARTAVFHEAIHLGTLEERDKSLTDDVLAQRDQVAALEGALLNQQISEVSARANHRSQLASLNSKLATLEQKAAQQAQETAAEVNQSVGGIAIDTGGMVQAPAGAPQAVREVIAAGNAIATLPYIWGGGHASFQASGYDCSGSVSYALAAAGLLSSPLDSTGFESWGDPGPGQWITVYANAGHAWMEVAGWRFDTVALAETGTRWAQGGGEFGGMVERHPPGL